MRGWAELAVDAGRVEAEFVKLVLKFSDVITNQDFARLVLQDAGAQRVGGLAECTQGDLADHTVGDDAAGLLEGLECLGQVGVKVGIAGGKGLCVGTVESVELAEPSEGCSNLCDSGIRVTNTQNLSHC